MQNGGRVEGRITVPAGGWTATVGGATATIAAGTYYADTLLVAVAAAFASAAATTCTATASLGAGGTGLVTIGFGSAKAIAWVTTDLRDLLGFTGDSASATSHVGTQHMRGTWLPACPYDSPNEITNDWAGSREGDLRTVGNHMGHSWSHMGDEMVVNWIAWRAVSRAKVWAAHEVVVNSSWERFHRDHVWGVAGWGTAGGPLRFYPDADDADTVVTYRVAEAAEIRPAPSAPEFVSGFWTIELPRLVQVPGSGPETRAELEVDELTTGSDSSDGTSFATASISPPADALILIAVTACRMSSAVGQNPTSITGAGLTFDLVEDNMFSEVTQARNLSIWRARSASPGTGALTITYPSNHSACVWSVLAIADADDSGSNGSGAIVQAKAGASTSPVSATFDTAIEHPNNLTIAAAASSSNSIFTPGDGFTEIAQDLETLAPCALITQHKQAAMTSSATIPGVSNLGIVLVEIKAMAA
jgi:hypothetical protein